MERLQRILASRGVASRRAAEELIREGRVSVNGVVVTALGTKADPKRDEIRVDNRIIRAQALRYLVLNKPTGYITTVKDERDRWTVMDLISVAERVFPVGRLDRDTTGLLIVTNDGELANRLMHPRHGVAKTYLAEVEGDPSAAALRRLAEGVELEDGPTAAAGVRRLAPSTIELVIHEGRNRQVRRMLEAVGHPVRSLHRSAYGGIELGDLPSGGWRRLSAGELERLGRA